MKTSRSGVEGDPTRSADPDPPPKPPRLPAGSPSRTVGEARAVGGAASRWPKGQKGGRPKGPSRPRSPGASGWTPPAFGRGPSGVSPEGWRLLEVLEPLLHLLEAFCSLSLGRDKNFVFFAHSIRIKKIYSTINKQL